MKIADFLIPSAFRAHSRVAQIEGRVRELRLREAALKRERDQWKQRARKAEADVKALRLETATEAFRFLKPGGLLVVTTHGAGAVSRFEEGKFLFNLHGVDTAAVGAEFRTNGFAYRNYRDAANYGVSFCSKEWMVAALAAIPGLEVCDTEESGWNRAQDVFVSRRKT